MSWSDVREAVRLAIAEATQLEDVAGLRNTTTRRVEWRNRATASRMVSGAWAELRFYSPVAMGVDETRYSFETNPDRLVPNYGGPRQFNVQVLLQADNQEPDADAVGILAGRLRTRLRRREILDALLEAGVAFVRMGPSIEVDYTDINGREISASTTEMTFACAEIDVDESEDASWIAELEYTLEVENGDADIEETVEVP